ncbi:MAG: hypothetical protein K9N51_09515, partial [Candidatus Pacebacteria bacterium]|nr:hypothetical protein [Candidatus Paceibacterota bacterium]
MELPEFDTRHLHARGEIVDTENVATLPHTTEDAIAFLADYANDLTTRCRVTADMGGSLYLPDASHTSSHFRTRDFASLLAGSPDTLDVQDLQNMIERLLATQREDGLFPETLASDGTPHYGRGNPVGESAPAYDVPQAVVSITWHVYQKTGDLAFLKKALPRLIKGITTLPCHARTELVHIAPDIPSTAYADGYTSTPNKKGDLLYSSLLYVQAQNDLADMAQSLGRDGDADMWRANAEHISKRIRMYLWDKDSALSRASTENAAAHDIWGSALAVYMNVATSGQLMAVSKYL